MTELPSLQELLPHDVPMVLIDELVDVGGKHVHCRVTPTADNLFFDCVARAVPGYIGIEFMAQSVAAWAGYHARMRGETPSVGFLLGCRRYKAEVCSFRENELLDIHAELVMENNGMSIFSCQIEHEGKAIAASQISTYAPTNNLFDNKLNKDDV